MSQHPNEKNKARIAISWILVATWAAFIFFMSAHTGSDLSNGEGFVGMVKQWLSSIQEAAFGPDIDLVSPLAHFIEYTVFGALVFMALSESGMSKRTLVAAIAICALYAISDELHQLYVPDRACDPVDWVVDVAGSTLGSTIARACNNRGLRR